MDTGSVQGVEAKGAVFHNAGNPQQLDITFEQGGESGMPAAHVNSTSAAVQSVVAPALR